MLNYGNSEKAHKESGSWFMAWLVICTLLLACLLNSGCANTCKGLGQTLQGVGNTISGAGQDVEEAVDNQYE